MRLRVVLPLALLAALAVVAVAGVGTASAKRCKSANYPGDGYFTQLAVRKVSCRTGRRLQVRHYRARVRNGGKDGYARRVMRFRCKERRNRIATELNSRVRCTRGSRVVRFFYQQNL